MERVSSTCGAGRVIDLTVVGLTHEEKLDPMALCSLHDDLKTRKLSGCLDILRDSATACALMKEAINDGWQMQVVHELNRDDVHLDMDTGLMTLFSAPSCKGHDYGMLVTLISALRDIAHEKRHGGFDDEYNLEDTLILSRVRMADCDVMSVLVAWELREAGAPGLWRYLIGSDKGDLALSFFKTMERFSVTSPAKKARNQALLHTFDQWFTDENRVSSADHQILNDLDDLVVYADGPVLVSHKTINPLAVEVLSCLPDKTAYLRGQGAEILSGPLYAGLADPINQTHFMQINRDLSTTHTGGVPFRDKALAARIFPV